MEGQGMLLVMLVVMSTVIIIAFLGRVIFTVEQQTVAVITRFGKFMRTEGPGLHFKSPLETVYSSVSLRLLQLDVEVQTKTKDNVFVDLTIPIMYKVMPTKVVEAVFKLDNVEEQIDSLVEDVVRAKVPTMDLDHVFENKDDIAEAVRERLMQAMAEYGYTIEKTLVTEVEPDDKVKGAMNDIQAATREKEAARQRAEATKITMVETARAEAESKKLQGEGIANQRQAIIDGLKKSVKDMTEATGVSADEVMTTILLTQYFDTMHGLAQSGQTKVVFFPNSPSGLKDAMTGLREALMVGQEATTKSAPTTKAA